MSRFIGHGPCSHCGSKDNVMIYDDDKPNQCGGCGYLHFPNQQEAVEPMINTSDLPFGTSKDRKVSDVIAEFFGVRRSVNSNGEVDAVHYPYFKNNSGDPTGYKIRSFPKAFKTSGDFSNIDLFGRGMFAPGGKRLVIVEGEEDCLAVAQAYKDKGTIWPVVSLPSANNMKPVLNNLEFVKSFDEVIIWMDNDEAGKKAKDQLAKIVGYGKAKIVSSNVKDASDLYTSQGGYPIQQAIWNATTCLLYTSPSPRDS